MEETSQVKAQSRFNYASDILQRVSYCQFKALEYYRKGDLESWFFEWKNIFYTLIGKFDKEEINILNKLEQKIKLFLYTPKNKTQTSLLTTLIEKYLYYIQIKIEDMGAGLVEKEDETTFA